MHEDQDIEELLKAKDQRIHELESQIGSLISSLDIIARELTPGTRSSTETTISAEFIQLLADLTIKQNAIFQMCMYGLSVTEIAEELFVHVGTVKNQLSRIYRKSGVNSRANLCLKYQADFMRADQVEYERIARLPKKWWLNRDDFPELDRLITSKKNVSNRLMP